MKLLYNIRKAAHCALFVEAYDYRC